MTRFEIIKSMNIKEMSVFLQNIYAMGYIDAIFDDNDRQTFDKKWLESEAEPYESINTKVEWV